MQVQFRRGEKYTEDFNKIIVSEQAADLDEHGSEDDRHDGHELDEDVDRKSGLVDSGFSFFQQAYRYMPFFSSSILIK